MSERGVFAVDRGIWDHPIFAAEPLTEREAWMWMISDAAYRPHRRRISGSYQVDLDRGQLGGSLRFMADKWGWSEPRVRRFLKRLKTDAMIDAATDAGITVVTICNYTKYQRVSLPVDAASDALDDAAATQQRRKVEDKENKEEETPSLRSGGVLPAKAKRERAKARTALPDDWQIDARDCEHATQLGFSSEKIRQMVSSFADYHRSKGSLMADWNAAWRTWCSNEIKFNRGPNGNRTGGNRTNQSASPRDTAVIAGMGRALDRRRAARTAGDGNGEFRRHPGAADDHDAERPATAGDDSTSGQLALVSRADAGT
jgi:hypothetical protein